MHHHHKLSLIEREQIALLQTQGCSNKQIGKRLGRPTSTIGRELKRNGSDTHYSAVQAQYYAQERMSQVANHRQELKNSDIYGYVTSHLREGWSPEQIAGRMSRDHDHDHHWRISAETIYRWIYTPKQLKSTQPWYEYLRRKQKKRRKRIGRKVHRSHIPDRISIHQRPEAINQRVVFGHWEGDSVEGKGHQGGLHTEVERMSRKILSQKVEDLTSQEAITAQLKLFSKLPPVARQSTTLDNGRETHLHVQLRDKLKMMTYHADPYSSWQRGTNEHGNWHLRYYFPKGTDFSIVSDEELQDIVEEINNRPRKILGYMSANEKFDQLLVEARGCI